MPKHKRPVNRGPFIFLGSIRYAASRLRARVYLRVWLLEIAGISPKCGYPALEAAMELTTLQVKQLKPRQKAYKAKDGGGLLSIGHAQRRQALALGRPVRRQAQGNVARELHQGCGGGGSGKAPFPSASCRATGVDPDGAPQGTEARGEVRRDRLVSPASRAWGGSTGRRTKASVTPRRRGSRVQANLLPKLGYKGRQTGHGFRGLASTFLHERGYEHEHIGAERRTVIHRRIDIFRLSL